MRMAAATINAPRIAVPRKAPKHPETEQLQGPGPVLLTSPAPAGPCAASPLLWDPGRGGRAGLCTSRSGPM